MGVDDDKLEDLDLPALGEADEGEGVSDDDDDDLGLRLTDDGQDDPFDDEVAGDVPLEIVLSTTEHESSAIDDDAAGLDDQPSSEGVVIDERSASLLDGDDQPMTFEGDDELGIDPIPTEVDDGGLEGLADQDEEATDAPTFPPLDGDEQEPDEEMDIGYEIGPPPTNSDP
ncbi:MAG: hypothetical protein DRI90_08690 [Deltaproteobacteria bacterium]|nr:MAG: hypothetical protein DRI90_08690 [Deltaproteobacteria bacterium]